MKFEEIKKDKYTLLKILMRATKNAFKLYRANTSTKETYKNLIKFMLKNRLFTPEDICINYWKYKEDARLEELTNNKIYYKLDDQINKLKW